MIDVIMLALQFAPVPTTGAYRAMEFAKRFPSLGIRPIVLTIDPDHAEQIFEASRNHKMLESIPDSVWIEYVRPSVEIRPESKIHKLTRMLFSLDDKFKSRFIRDLEIKVKKLGNEYDIKAIYATAPPFGATGLGEHISKLLGVPYLIDMRDAWSEWSPAPQVSRLHYFKKFIDERRAFHAADKIVGVTEELVNLFQQSHPDLPKDRFSVIPNGLSSIESVPDQVEWNDTETFMNIGYVGSFYYIPPKPPSFRSPHRYLQYNPGKEDWSYRSPLFFFRSWKALYEIDSAAASRIRFHLVGSVPPWLPEMAAEYGVLDKCIFHGAKPKSEIPAFLESMTGLLATSMKRVNGDDYCLASKTFEYISSGKPALAYVCKGSQKRFFENSGGAIFFEPDDINGSALKLQSISKQSLPIRNNKNYLKSYTLDFTAARMADELINLTTTIRT